METNYLKYIFQIYLILKFIKFLSSRWGDPTNHYPAVNYHSDIPLKLALGLCLKSSHNLQY